MDLSYTTAWKNRPWPNQIMRITWPSSREFLAGDTEDRLRRLLIDFALIALFPERSLVFKIKGGGWGGKGEVWVLISHEILVRRINTVQV